MTVYADVLAVTNLYVDFFLLWCVRRSLHLRVRNRRLALGAAVGAACSLVCLLPQQPLWLALLWGGGSAALTTAAAFCPLSRREDEHCQPGRQPGVRLDDHDRGGKPLLRALRRDSGHLRTA